MYQLKILGQNEIAARFKVERNGTLLSFKEVFTLWENDVNFIDFYVNALNKFNFAAFFWEHPGLTTQTSEKSYECILQNSKTLDGRTVNEQAFADYIHSENEAEDFLNLGKNARLVIPTKKSDIDIYKHFSSFLRQANPVQIQALFQKTGKIVQEEIAEKSMIWLNTAGMGVLWLHIRMDTKPKYYKTKNYKRTDFF